MSLSRSSSLSISSQDEPRSTKRDKPPALDLHPPSESAPFPPREAVDTFEDDDTDDPSSPEQPTVQVAFPTLPVVESEPRSTSAASSALDAYYFTTRTPAESPAPPVPPLPPVIPQTPELGVPAPRTPITPARKPEDIDRRGLVGVGELATPRWARVSHETRHEHMPYRDRSTAATIEEAQNELEEGEQERDAPDSPWTIEAVDEQKEDFAEEEEENEEDRPVNARTLRAKRSMASESGGEEILYPRKLPITDVFKLPTRASSPVAGATAPTAPTTPSTARRASAAVTSPSHRSRKQPSEDLGADSSDLISSSSLSSPRARAEERASGRKHRSLGVGLPQSASSRDKVRRESASAATTLGGTPRAVAKHSRSSSSSSQEQRRHRAHATDFSHLPPSPSSASIPAFLRQPSGAHTSSQVAHSLLRGTQEGWSSLDDEATAEALRKLDGISGKSTHARTRQSVSSSSRPSSAGKSGSRPGTPGAGKGSQWEGISSSGEGRSSRNSRKSHQPRDSVGVHSLLEAASIQDSHETAIEDAHAAVSSGAENKPPGGSAQKKRLSSLAAKRVSSSSSATNYTGTGTASSSRDSGSASVGTSLTSMSTRHSLVSAPNSKPRRNSAGSDVSAHSSDVASLRDRAAAIAANGEGMEGEVVPPVPPLPKDLSGFRSPPHSTTSMIFPSMSAAGNAAAVNRLEHDTDADKTISADAQSIGPLLPSPTKVFSPPSASSSTSTAAVRTQPKTPSKKWSFSSALNINVKSLGSPSSPSSSSKHNLLQQQLGSPPSTNLPSKDVYRVPSLASTRSADTWAQPDAMASAASFGSVSSLSTQDSPSAANTNHLVTASSTPDRNALSRTETASSASVSTHLTGTQLAPAPSDAMSPSSSLRRGGSTKQRLTPSSIPFFSRRSSSTSRPAGVESDVGGGNVRSASPSQAKASVGRLRVKSTMSPPTESGLMSPTTPGSSSSSAHKKASVLSLGFPSLLRGSSSRKSLQSGEHSDNADSTKEREKKKLLREQEKAREKAEKERKKEDRERSESRISALMGRKRGKTLSSATDPKKIKSTSTALPPMQMNAIPPSTAQRVASIKSNGSSSNTTTPTNSVAARAGSSRATSQTISSLHKQSDTSLRSTRAQLPTIAGSPSVAQSTKELKDNLSMPPPSAFSSSITKETPTKIPRITGRASATSSPTMKGATTSTRRVSVNAATLAAANAALDMSPSPSLTATNDDMTEFGMFETDVEFVASPAQKSINATPNNRLSIRASPSATLASGSKPVTRQISGPSTVTAAGTRKNRESLSFSGLRKASTGSVTSLASAAPSSESQQTQSSLHQRFSALSPSKGLKLLSPRITRVGTRSSSNAAATSMAAAAAATASSSRRSPSTPSPVPSVIDEDESIADEEMMHYIRKQQQKKLASGATQEEIDDMMRFPDPLPPAPSQSPQDVLNSSHVKYLSEYERKEILDYEKVYFYGQRSHKKPATPDNTTNNFGYDDDRGDYLVVSHDHFAYRYEVVGSLGKGSFGQVLRCRDHATGEFVAIKIIRNKKRFHHQAMVEIKILDNLRKWDPEDKHQVIKMNEYFNFRGHLCIAMELLSINLYELIKANSFVGFSTALIRRFTNQMLLSLDLMRVHRIVHCDLKPENVLLKHPAKSAIKVIDFGSSCLEHEKIYTYIQSRFYRSPEVIMGMNYHMAIDMWSLGCIMAELYTGFPIFPGENEQEQLSCIMEVLGVPDKDYINRSSRKKLFFDPSGAPRPVVNSKGRRRRPGTKTLQQVLRCDDELFIDFVAKCLTWDPERRLKPHQALRHPYITPRARSKIASPAPTTSAPRSLLSSAASSSGSSRSKPTETPKKSQISAPTPLTARISRTNSSTVANSTPSGPSASSSTLGSTSRPYRASQSQTFSTYQSSSRTVANFATAK